MKFKKFLYFMTTIISICLVATTISACSNAPKTTNNENDDATKESVTTTALETSNETTTTAMQALPECLRKFIDDADKLFIEGMYAEAVSAYRTAKGKLLAASALNPDVIKKNIEEMKVNADKAKTITDTARLHYGNAMQLIYEKRVEEALFELEEALAIYPKYQDARDALDSLKALHDLK